MLCSLRCHICVPKIAATTSLRIRVALLIRPQSVRACASRTNLKPNRTPSVRRCVCAFSANHSNTIASMDIETEAGHQSAAPPAQDIAMEVTSPQPAASIATPSTAQLPVTGTTKTKTPIASVSTSEQEAFCGAQKKRLQDSLAAYVNGLRLGSPPPIYPSEFGDSRINHIYIELVVSICCVDYSLLRRSFVSSSVGECMLYVWFFARAL